MKALKLYLIVGLSCFFAVTAAADIYQWTDENGVRHFTNYAPRDGARVIAKTRELAFDETADSARREADRQYLLQLARLEKAEQEAQQRQREARARRRLIEAEQQAREKLRQAENLLTAARQIADSDGSRGGYFYSGYAYPCYPVFPYNPCRPPHVSPPHIRPPHVGPPHILPIDRRLRKRQRAGYGRQDRRSSYFSTKRRYPKDRRMHRSGHHQGLGSLYKSRAHRSGIYGRRTGGLSSIGIRVGYRRR